MSKFDTHTYRTETFDLDGPDNRAGQVVATRKSDGAELTFRVYSNGDDKVILHVLAEGPDMGIVLQNETGDGPTDWTP